VHIEQWIYSQTILAVQRPLMLRQCGLETEARTISICCCPDALLAGNHLFFLLYLFILFCLCGVAKDWRVLRCSGASVAFTSIIMSESIYHLPNVISQCLHFSHSMYFGAFHCLFTNYHRISSTPHVNIMDQIFLIWRTWVTHYTECNLKCWHKFIACPDVKTKINSDRCDLFLTSPLVT